RRPAEVRASRAYRLDERLDEDVRVPRRGVVARDLGAEAPGDRIEHDRLPVAGRGVQRNERDASRHPGDALDERGALQQRHCGPFVATPLQPGAPGRAMMSACATW